MDLFRKKSMQLVLVAGLGALLILRCGGSGEVETTDDAATTTGDNNGTSGSTPTSSAEAPTITGPSFSSSTAVAVTSDLCVTASTAMDTTTITTQTFTVVPSGGSNICTKIDASNSDKTFCCDYNGELAARTEHTLTISKSVKNTEGTSLSSDVTSAFTTTCGSADDFTKATIVNDPSSHPKCWTFDPTSIGGAAAADMWSISNGLIFQAPTVKMTQVSLGGLGLGGMYKTIQELPYIVTIKLASISNMNLPAGGAGNGVDALGFYVTDGNQAMSDTLYGYGIFLYHSDSTNNLVCTVSGGNLGSGLALGSTNDTSTNPCNTSGPIWFRISRTGNTFATSYKTSEAASFTELHSGTLDSSGNLLANTIGTTTRIWFIPKTADTQGTMRLNFESLTTP